MDMLVNYYVSAFLSVDISNSFEYFGELHLQDITQVISTHTAALLHWCKAV